MIIVTTNEDGGQSAMTVCPKDTFHLRGAVNDPDSWGIWCNRDGKLMRLGEMVDHETALIRYSDLLTALAVEQKHTVYTIGGEA